jgi:hypothetical protein
MSRVLYEQMDSAEVGATTARLVGPQRRARLEPSDSADGEIDR